ncbi:hypothetical protein P7B02_12030 [Caulobacter segnis]|uniref:hypothetical protein n=1 Tax=Caulobacter segnis TaxID=88688 RepID=UPI00240F00E0|nr:hypothetical protein [Caulobacter segnis]MDG2522271.1 hypothetical protein [Caulobacter segnis]
MPRTAPRPIVWSSSDQNPDAEARAELNWAILAAISFCGAVWAGALLLASAVVN